MSTLIQGNSREFRSLTVDVLLNLTCFLINYNWTKAEKSRNLNEIYNLSSIFFRIYLKKFQPYKKKIPIQILFWGYSDSGRVQDGSSIFLGHARVLLFLETRSKLNRTYFWTCILSFLEVGTNRNVLAGHSSACMKTITCPCLTRAKIRLRNKFLGSFF